MIRETHLGIHDRNTDIVKSLQNKTRNSIGTNPLSNEEEEEEEEGNSKRTQIFPCLSR